MASAKKIVLGVILLLLTMVGAFVCYFVWPPDIFGKVTVLASAQSQSGEQFKIVQFWGADFYTTQLEQVSPDGTQRTTVIDGDDKKQWSCSVNVIDSENKLIIAIPAGSEPFEYRWDQTVIPLPLRRKQLHD